MKKKLDKSVYGWAFIITVITFFLSLFFSFLSTTAISKLNLLPSIIILFLVIFIGIIFDLIGVAVTVAEEKDFHAKASKKINQSRLWDATLYVTLEPCTMCATAISMMRIKKLIFGAQNPKGGAVINGVKFFESTNCFHKPEIVNGIYEEESSTLLKSFFKLKRNKI